MPSAREIDWLAAWLVERRVDSIARLTCPVCSYCPSRLDRAVRGIAGRCTPSHARGEPGCGGPSNLRRTSVPWAGRVLVAVPRSTLRRSLVSSCGRFGDVTPAGGLRDVTSGLRGGLAGRVAFPGTGWFLAAAFLTGAAFLAAEAAAFLAGAFAAVVLLAHREAGEACIRRGARPAFDRAPLAKVDASLSSRTFSATRWWLTPSNAPTSRTLRPALPGGQRQRIAWPQMRRLGPAQLRPPRSAPVRLHSRPPPKERHQRRPRRWRDQRRASCLRRPRLPRKPALDAWSGRTRRGLRGPRWPTSRLRGERWR